MAQQSHPLHSKPIELADMMEDTTADDEHLPMSVVEVETLSDE
jgi:hypothetical protein